MADNEEGEETAARGHEWEVVQLTASTYAAAPGTQPNADDDDDGVVKKGDYVEGDEAETSRALFMSGHFVFPPSQHENLPLEPEVGEISNQPVGSNVTSEYIVEEGDKSGGKDEDNWALKGLNVPEEFPGIQFFDDKGNGMSVSDTKLEEARRLQDSKFSGKEQSVYSTATFSSLHGETGLGGSTAFDEDFGITEVDVPSERELDFPREASHSPKPVEDDKCDGSNIPCEAWWKRRAAALYAHAKEANTFWSIFIAAAVMGLVIIGQRWQQERWQVLQIKWQTSLNSERSGRMLGPLYRLKDVIVGGHRRGSFIGESSSSS